LSVLRYPRSAASFHLNPFIFRPVASTASRIPRLTARSTARSAGSGRCFFNERDGEKEGQGRKSDARLRVEVPLSLARARLDAARRLDDHRGW
jgi:hypothetical protein